MRILLTLLLQLFAFGSYCQDTIPFENLYFQKDIAYQVVDDKLFSGTAIITRKNNELSQSFDFYKGVVQIENQFYRNRNNQIATKLIYDPDIPYRLMVKRRFFSGIEESTYYNSAGERILVEQVRNKNVIYSCQYSGKRKHGIEKCLNPDGTTSIIEYRNGKKVKN